MEVSSEIIAKIQKLLALAGNNTNEHEAGLAAERVQELCARYNLTLAAVSAKAKETSATQVEPEKRANKKVHRGAMYQYQKTLWEAVAAVNFCLHWIAKLYDEDVRIGGTSRRPVKRHVLVGREVNVTAATLLGEYLEEAINRICPLKGSQALSAAAIAWKLGCAERLAERLYHKKVTLEKETAQAAGTAVVLASYYADETAANWDSMYGVGWYAAWKKKHAERSEEEKKVASEKHYARWKKEQRQQDKYREREDYYKGRQAAEQIGLDAQVPGKASGRITTP